MVQFRLMVKDFLRKRYRDWIAYRVIGNGEALRVLCRDRLESRFAGVSDPQLDKEIDRRVRLREKLLDKLRQEDS